MSTDEAIQKRAEAYAHLDQAKLGWFHLRAVLVSGVGFFTDAYDIFVISQALPMIYQVYYPQTAISKYKENVTLANGTTVTETLLYTPQNHLAEWDKQNPYLDATVKTATSYGNLVGQLAFGYLGDKLGRKKMYGIELLIMIVCTLGSVLSGQIIQGWSILVVLCIWRFFLGIGIGGDYPMSAVITSEFANVNHRGMMLAAVFAMQGIGILLGGLAYVIVLLAFKDQIESDYTYLDYVWRIVIGLGIVPAIAAIYFRLTIPETPRYTVDVNGDTEKAARDVQKVMAMNSVANVTSGFKEEDVAVGRVEVKQNTFSDFCIHFGKWENFKVLFGAAYCWFALDVAWYGLSLNQSTVLTLINFNGPKKNKLGSTIPHNVWDTFYQKAIGNIIIACAGTVPGYWFTVGLVETLGRKPIQYMGFGVITIILFILAAMWDTISTQQVTFMVLFTIAQFFFQFGPNSTTFIVPGEVFPTRWRSTGHGIAAASGKLGAIVGVQFIGPIFASNVKTVLWAFGAIMFSGLAATALVPETKGKTLEELSGENDEDIFVERSIQLDKNDKKV